jgi:hypothetical protein
MTRIGLWIFTTVSAIIFLPACYLTAIMVFLNFGGMPSAQHWAMFLTAASIPCLCILGPVMAWMGRSHAATRTIWLWMLAPLVGLILFVAADAWQQLSVVTDDIPPGAKVSG